MSYPRPIRKNLLLFPLIALLFHCFLAPCPLHGSIPSIAFRTNNTPQFIPL